MLTQLKTNPNMRDELKKLGYADEQIPGWVAEAAAEAAQSEAAKAALPALPALPALLMPLYVQGGRARIAQPGQVRQVR